MQQASAASSTGQRPTEEELSMHAHNANSAQLRFANLRFLNVSFIPAIGIIFTYSGFDINKDCFAHDSPPSFCPLLDATIKQKMKNFIASGKELVIRRCASCGEKKLDDSKFVTVRLSDVDVLQCDQRRSELYRNNPHIRQYLTIFSHDDKLFDLHEKLLFRNNDTLLIPTCGVCGDQIAKSIRPKFNVGNECDYGQNMPQLSVAEAILTSRTVLFQTVYNLNGTDVKVCRGHTINFEHSGARVFAEQLPRLDIKDMLQVVFIGSKEKFNLLTKLGESRNKFLAAHRQLSVDPLKVLHFLRIKALVDPAYKNIQILDDISFMQQIENELIESAIVSEDPTSAKIAKESGARLHVDSSASGVAVDQEQLTTENIFVHKTVCPPIANTANILRITSQTVNGVATGHTSQYMSSIVELLPTNEYSENEKTFLGGFSHLFFLGEGIPKGSSSLSASLVEHLLMQYDNRFATNAHFLFTIFNQLQRHAAASDITFRVKNNNKALTTFKDLMAGPEFQTQISNALQDPTSQSSNQLARTILDIVKISGRDIPWSGMEREHALCKIIALSHYAGPYSFFVTVCSIYCAIDCFNLTISLLKISPADMDSALMLQLAQAGSDEEVARMTLQLPTLKERHRILSTNPVAAALAYIKLVEAMFIHLLGLSPSNLSHTSQPLMDAREDGFLGKPVAFAAVTEGQGRESAHLHFIAITDLAPHVIRKYIDDSVVMHQLTQRLDSLVKCWLPNEAHETDIKLSSGNCKEPTPEFRDGRNHINVDDAAAVQKRVEDVVLKVNKHQHTTTCRKSRTGRYKCRLAMPRAQWGHETCALQLICVKDQNGNLVPRALRDIQPPISTNIDPLKVWDDDRIIVLELYRPNAANDANATETTDDGAEYWVDIAETGANSDIVSYSPALSAVMCCNTCVEYLGTNCQAKSAMYYLVKYITKDASDLENVLSLIQAASSHISKYPSVAPDSGTLERSTKHILSRILNSINGHCEVGGQIAALAALRFPSNIFSHDFTYCYIRPGIKWCKSVHSNHPPQLQTSDQTTEDYLQPETPNNGELNADVDVFDTGNNNDDSGETLVITQGPTTLNAVPQFEHYKFRSRALADLSFYVWSACINVVSRCESSANSDRHRNAQFDFDSRHPLYSTHTQRLRTTQKIPILAGAPPPKHPGRHRNDNKWKTHADIFAAYLIVLHYPWSTETFAPPIELTWNSLQSWVASLANPANTWYIDKARLFWLRNLSNTSISAATLKITSAWRGRCAHYWNEPKTVAKDNATETQVDFSAQLLEDLQHISDAVRTTITKEQQHAMNCCRVLETLHATDEVSTPTTEEINTNEFSADTTVRTYERIVSATTEVLPTTSMTSFPAGDGGIPSLNVNDPMGAVVFESIEGLNLNPEQQSAFVRIVKWHNDYSRHQADPIHNPAPQSLKLLICGPAGTGKSHLIRALVSRIGEKKIVNTAFTGVVASSLPTGRTVNSAFAIPVRGGRRATPHRNGRTPSISSSGKALHSLGDAHIIVIDEISLISASMLLAIDVKLRSWFDKDVAFGGLAIVALGDFFQIPCVGARSLVAASLDPLDPAGRLFNEFSIMSFTIQQRAAQDVEHANRLLFFRNPAASTFPVRASNVLDHLHSLSKADIEGDPKWLEAPIIVTDNVTRRIINKQQLQQFACKTGQPIFAWRNELSPATYKVFSDSASMQNVDINELLEQYDELTFYFARGAPAMLKSNIGVDRRLSNGSTCVLHSITFNPSCKPTSQQLASLLPGQVFFLETPPLSVNVQLANQDISTWPRGHSLSTSAVIVPMMILKTEEDLKMHNKELRLSYYSYNVDLAFCITFHKVQGMTLDRIIIDLNSPALPKVTCASLYVALSRVRQGNHIRLLAPLNDVRRKELLNLEFRTDLLKWLARMAK